VSAISSAAVWSPILRHARAPANGGARTRAREARITRTRMHRLCCVTHTACPRSLLNAGASAVSPLALDSESYRTGGRTRTPHRSGPPGMRRTRAAADGCVSRPGRLRPTYGPVLTPRGPGSTTPPFTRGGGLAASPGCRAWTRRPDASAQPDSQCQHVDLPEGTPVWIQEPVASYRARRTRLRPWLHLQSSHRRAHPAGPAGRQVRHACGAFSHLDSRPWSSSPPRR
jgi:hypothetical protein